MLKEKQSGNFLSIIGGSIRKTVPEGTSGAVRRDYETSDGKTGTKHELIYTSVTGKIDSVKFFEGDFGKQLVLQMFDGEESYSLQIGVEQPYAEDLMKKLPAVDRTKEIELVPFDFADDNGKRRRGVTINQNGEKLENYFWDKEAKKAINGFPQPEGDVDSYDKEDWKIHFMKVRKFLINFIQEKFQDKNDFTKAPVKELSEDEIPF